jgi:DNA replication and repair protein RecF
MTIKRLSYQGFRNLSDGVFEPDRQVNVLYGRNAQGKTNLIEALWLFTGSRSFRGAKDAELLCFGAENGRLEMDFEAAGRAQQIKINIDANRSAELGGIPLDSPLKLSGEFCAVVFSPEHLGLVKEGPAPRRKFIDSAICQLRPQHCAAVLEYKKALTQRNALLKDIPFHSSLLDTLDVWDDRLVKTGAHIIFTRLRYLKRLSQKACGIYSGIAKAKEELNINYTNFEGNIYSFELNDSKAAVSAISKALKSDMDKNRALDIESGYTHAGSHRDDLQILIGGISARSYGSQGQQRSAVLSLKLAEAAVLSETIGEPPVLLLDDVLSELDADRRDYLLNNIGGMQVFITCCDPLIQGALNRGAVYEIDAGKISTKIRL